MTAKVAIITGSMAPYTHRMYDAYARKFGGEVVVFQCTQLEPSRQWNLSPAQSYGVSTLRGYRYHKSDISHIYFNPSVVPELMRLKPDVVVMASFSPTMLLGGLYAIASGSALGIYVEGDRSIDPGDFSWPHGAARRFFGSRASFGMCTSQSAVEMMEHWGLKRGAGVMVPHCGSWSGPDVVSPVGGRPYDLLLCGTLNPRKNSLFLADLVGRMIAQGYTPTVRVVGDGELRQTLDARLREHGVIARFDGYLQQAEIIAAYSSCKLLVFPTLADTWGLVANEALECGTPVLTSPHAVSSRDLVTTFGTGEVRELDAEVWAQTAIAMLSSPERLQRYMRGRTDARRHFSVDAAVEGLHRAIEIGLNRSRLGGGLGATQQRIGI